MYNLPNILTLSRIVVIPVIFLSVYISCTWWSALTAILFVVAAITDYFDGYLARTRNQISVFGRLLDPIADKLLVISALLIIVANQMVHPVSYIPVMIILCREILVSGLREFLANVKVSLPVTNLAKWKTGFQMTSLGMILFGVVPYFGIFAYVGEFLLWIAGILTFITGYEYFKKSFDYVKSLNDKEEAMKNKKTVAEPAKKVSVVVKPVVAKKKTEKVISSTAGKAKAVKEKAVKTVKPKPKAVKKTIGKTTKKNNA